MDVPDGFLWGAATSAAQVEGDRAGRGESIWDAFSRRPGAVADPDGVIDAVDHLARFDEDVALMRQLGLGAYRFSIAWPRVRPDGDVTDLRGLDVYDRMVDVLLAAGIEPMVTLYHWDLPQRVEERGGWPHRDTPKRFADLAAEVADRLGDRVRLWTTLNEPWCSAFLGYERGVHAPGRRDEVDAVAAMHHLLLGHGWATAAIRDVAGARAEVGITLNLHPIDPASDDEVDVDAATLVDATQNRGWLDPVLRGRYPEDLVSRWEGYRDAFEQRTGAELVRDGDLASIAAPLDHLGLNYYRTFTAGSARRWEGTRPAGPGLDGVVELPPEGPLTTMGWPIEPEGLHRMLVRLSREYDAPPLYVTENGAAFPDEPDATGQVHDADRIAFLRDHFDAAGRAIADGVDLRGYLVWSLLDNLEWAEGFRPTFGLVRVDRATMERTVKDSGWWLAERLGAGR